MIQDIRKLSAEQTGGRLVFEWIMSLVFTGVSGFALYQLVTGRSGPDMPFWAWLVVGLFHLIGLWLVWKAARNTLDRMRHGRVTLLLDAPLHLGGRLAGTLEIGSVSDLRQVQLVLACEATVWTKDARHESSIDQRETTIWNSSHTATVDALGRVRVDFTLPRDQPASSYPGSFGASSGIEYGRDYVRWRLHVMSEGASVDLERSIELPVAEGAAGAMPDDGPMVIEIEPAAREAAADFRLPSARKEESRIEPVRKRGIGLKLALLVLPLVIACAVVLYTQPQLPAQLPAMFRWSVPHTGEFKRVKLPPSYVVDLETAAFRDGPSADLWWHFVTATERYLEGRNGAVFATLDRNTDFNRLDAAQVGALDFRLRSLPAQGSAAVLEAGALFGVRTGEGNYAKLRVLSINEAPKDGLLIEWELFVSAPAARAADARPAAPAPGPGANPAGKAAARDWRQRIDLAVAAIRDKRPEDAARLAAEALAGAEASGARGGQLAWVYYRTGVLAWSLRDLATAGERMQHAVSLVEAMPRQKVAAEVGSDETQFAAEVHRFLAVIRRDQSRLDEAYAAIVKARHAYDPAETSRYGPGYAAMKLHSILRETSGIECMRRNKQAALKAMREARDVAAPHPGLAGNARGAQEEAERIESGRRCGH